MFVQCISSSRLNGPHHHHVEAHRIIPQSPKPRDLRICRGYIQDIHINPSHCDLALSVGCWGQIRTMHYQRLCQRLDTAYSHALPNLEKVQIWPP